MPKISSRGLHMPESPIRKLAPFAEATAKRGTKIYYLNIGQPDIDSPSQALDAVKGSNLRVLEYSPSAGFASYREGLAKYYRGIGLHVEAQDVLVTTGGSEALSFAMGSILDPGDEVLIPEPYYANYFGFAQALGAKVVSVPSSIQSGFALPPIADLQARITARTKAVLVCNPGNPTGYVYRHDELEALRDMALKHDLFVIADEVYREFVYDGAEAISVMSLAGLEQHAVLIDSVSKRYSMCGARIGCMVSKNSDLMGTALKFAQARLSPPTYEQIAAEAALATPASYFKEVNAEYTARRDTLVGRLNAISGVFCPKPRGAFYAVAELPVDDAEAFCRWMIEDFTHNGETVMMAPAAGFYADRSLGKRQVRLAYVLKQSDLERAMDVLEQGLASYPGRTN
ncbi:MAG: pyridoxal phosphate-dependent aminotransferase [Schleiferiaceae bacterium]|nr:pyridoxal phosphate-dependent aminotransferase [Schleiferiaceae bacterium]MDP4629060.1 pyridoxal phosphate-dependent aminotransferase [Schleiferiaceae bacterium]MDP4774109.1 pyridoxal phosphate-dependent aminotransferase [Schleiferiaceae bacterium]MDP4932398.1 pyridoxal phosphate-dependent aminotransferase [Schleiferiaceae bacterium]